MNNMGQNSSQMGGRFKDRKLSLFWIIGRTTATQNSNPEQPIKFQYKTRRKKSNKDKTLVANNNTLKKYSASNNLQTLNNFNKSDTNQSVNNVLHKSSKYSKDKNSNEVRCQIIKTQNAPFRTKSEPNLIQERERQKHRRKNLRSRSHFSDVQQFGYEIEDIDGFLTKATIDKPANIPVVLAFPSVLYQTRVGGYQAEIFLPLGMVVNAIFKNEHWLYVQTPHAEEGYVNYAACLPLGIIPPADDDENGPCWEKSTDVFPRPSGNISDSEKLSCKSFNADDNRQRRRARNSGNSYGEKSVDGLYLKATASSRSMGVRHTLLVITKNYDGMEKNAMKVKEGEVVFLLNSSVQGWFWVRNKEGCEGFIPAAIAGHGFL
ncbi:uncharacterized protein LOC123313589 [Coccinella septempunctata]|uniref:uncharacterized protein LOC123313589 n=1 Tax=Coccinella septempunctata TaxID=41139 RepID=UPI001D08A248|nr:uncharacterized protein LOC123313589 [Coccinella septempunctata]XP_044754466.1 uncharacterized protein LOC123313589 [Coccinella septempunctata]XP_044754467.1 uncharacterized protein LOC123313589 [Coccinella septempunctata]